MFDTTSKDDELDDILNEFLIWHWEQFKTGKYEKLADVPHSWKQQGKARKAIKQYGIQERIDALSEFNIHGEGVSSVRYDGIHEKVIELTALKDKENNQ